jgi:sugar lactone lactonase YvrE
VYVADTWNYRVQVFTAQGEYLTSWGQRGEFGASAQMQPVDGFWGPRAIAVDSEERVYVADTGNKRIRVYDSNGQYIRDIGSAGSAIGQLDEPSGIVVGQNNLLYVADYWNRRISVFTLDGLPATQFLGSDGQATNTFKVRGWLDDQGNRPYMALDTARNEIYVTDPDAGRVMVFDTLGSCVGSFGQLGHENLDLTQFTSIGGVATDSQGNVYVADAAAGRILRFSPFEPPVAQPPADQSSQNQVQIGAPESTSQVVAPVGAEVTPESTPEAAG